VIPLWMRNVISLCATQQGRITAEEVANVAALAGRYSPGSVLISEMKKNRHMLVEVVNEAKGERGRRIKVYRITRREAATEHATA
jgi:hypothetical protein